MKANKENYFFYLKEELELNVESAEFEEAQKQFGINDSDTLFYKDFLEFCDDYSNSHNFKNINTRKYISIK